jgi:DedD protein
MATATSQDTEITLGTGKMLALFFGLVALCAVFFGMGFSLGRSSVRIASPDVPATTTVTTGGQRPSAVKTNNATTPADMTFYKAVESKDGNTQPVVKEAAAETSETAAPASAAATPDPTAPPSVNSYYVQVAAVSKAEDAAALVDALKKKQYTCRSGRIRTSKMPN